ncbi:hypothetical protein MTO96_029808 [Rhipicephalus appendiculatus]
MSTSVAASQPTMHAHADFLALLPPEVWTEVFLHLDFDSLVNMAQAAPELKSFALSPTILRSVTFDPEADERTVAMFLRAKREELDVQNQVKDVPFAANVEELRFAHCLVLSSEVILDCIQHCDNLRQLYCVNCVVEPAELFVLLSTKLTRVRKLQWSLHDEKHYESRLDIEEIALIGTFSKTEGPKVVTMYVEVSATEKTEFVLDQFLPRCGMLRRLHLHAVVKGQPPPQSRIQFNVDLLAKPPAQFNVRRLAEVVKDGKVLKGFQQVTVHMDADSQAASLFAEAAANYADSLECLAGGCALLEHLDVRSSIYKTTASPCDECQLPFDITKRNIESLHEKTRLRRLSIDETANILNMEFLLGCRVEELRLGLCDEALAQCPRELCRLLAANPRLSSLTLLARKVTLSSCLAAALSQIQCLRHLCVLTMVSHKYPMAEEFVFCLEDVLPQLQTAHVHYACACKMMQSRSWIRQRRPSSGSKTGEGTFRTKQGVYMHDKPCLGKLCCIDSFIGLVRPRNRF